MRRGEVDSAGQSAERRSTISNLLNFADLRSVGVWAGKESFVSDSAGYGERCGEEVARESPSFPVRLRESKKQKSD